MGIVTIGLEIHISLSTDKKSFSPDKSDDVSWITLGFPGTLPYLNIHAVGQVIKLSKALNCQVNYSNITFDRKNYFHYDLPRGYQITQYFNPLGTSGHIQLSSGKKIRIKQIHMEEDTAQQYKHQDQLKFNFSRLGHSLAEVVTEPDFENYEEVQEFLQLLRRVCAFNAISLVRYEKGEIRVDLNLSVRKAAQDPLNNKSEVKNLNSLLSIKKSIEYLVSEFNKDPDKSRESITYTWSEQQQACLEMRKKSSTSDYFYIPESNIPPLSISDSKYSELTESMVVDFEELKSNFISEGLKESEARFLLDNHDVFLLVTRLNKKLNNLQSSYNWIVNIASGIMESRDWDSVSFEEIEKTILCCDEKKKISLKIAKSILKEIIQEGSTFDGAYSKLGVSLITDPEKISQLVANAFAKYKDSMEELKKNPMKMEKLIIGECMKESKGQADPKLVKQEFDSVVGKY